MNLKPPAPNSLFSSDAKSPELPIGRIRDPQPVAGRVDMTALIRSLQRAEGESPCFRTGQGDCDRTDCPWRRYCL